MIRHLTAFLLCLLIALNCLSQPSKGSFYVTGKVKVDQGVVDGTHIELFRNSIRIQDMVINRNGTFRVIVELNQNYRFYFSNSDYYPKSIEFDTHIPAGVCESNCEFPPYELALLLYKKVPGVSEMPQQPAKISYNPKLDVFDAEILRQESDIKKMINDALADAKQKATLYDQKKIMDKRLNYERLIKDADSYFRTGDLDKAMRTYRDAAMILPNEKYPRDRVDQAYHLLVSSELQKSFGNPSSDNFLKYLNYGDLKFSEREYTKAMIAYEGAIAVKPDDQSVQSKFRKSQEEVAKIKDLAWEEINHKKDVYASRTTKYNQLIASGNEQLLKDNILGAKDSYAQAATQIDENSYALLMLQKIEEMASNEEIAIRLARDREIADKKRLADARNKAYTDAVEEADKLLSQRLYPDAIENYELALTIKDYELYPKKQIETINDILAKLQLNGEEYNRLIREGDQLMQQKAYLVSKESFQKAHDLIPEEKYALKKIAEIDELLKKEAEEDVIQQQYSKVLSDADGLFNQKKYNEAIVAYQKASTIRPTEKYPKEQILKIRGILSRESEEQRILLQKQTEYDQIISQADEAFDKQSYQNARSLYLKALQVLPGQEYPSSQIKKIDAILSNMALVEKTKPAEVNLADLQKMSKDERDAAYKLAMEMGESFMKSKEWGVARFYFRRALSIYPDDPPATQRLYEAEKMLRGNDVNESKFTEFVKKADESFKTGDISVAKFYYAKALEIKPSDNYAKERFEVTVQLLKATQISAGEREFEDAISKGDNAFASKNYSLARFFYRKALSLKPGNSKATEKLKLSEDAMANDKIEAGNSEYDRNIQMGDKAFEQKNYGVARTYYRQALILKPNDQYSKDQLVKIEELLRK